MKLGNIFPSDTFIISQSPHGLLQDGQSLDCFGGGSNPLGLIAPSDGKVVKEYLEGSTQQYYMFVGDGFSIILVHADAIRLGNYKRGEKLGHSTWHHIHTAIYINGKWDVLLNYMDRSIKIKTTFNPSNGWDDWDRYPDLHINGNDMDCMEVQQQLKECNANRMARGVQIRNLQAKLKESEELRKECHSEKMKRGVQIRNLQEKLRICEAGQSINAKLDEIIEFINSKKV